MSNIRHLIVHGEKKLNGLLIHHDRLRNLVALDRLAAAVTSSVSRELMFDLRMRSYQMTTSPPANSCCPARGIRVSYRERGWGINFNRLALPVGGKTGDYLVLPLPKLKLIFKSFCVDRAFLQSARSSIQQINLLIKYDKSVRVECPDSS